MNREQTMLTSQQSLSIRYTQGIGIISVVLGHYGIIPFFVPEPYLFHMPLFFLLGGMLYKDGSFSKTLKNVATKHLWYIIYTFTIISAIALALHENFNLRVGDIYSDGLLSTITHTLERNFHNNGYFLVSWFLFAYAIVSLLCKMVLYIKNKFILLIIAFGFGYYGMDYAPHIDIQGSAQIVNLLSQVLVGSMFYLFGYIFRSVLLSVSSLYIPALALSIIFTMKNYSITGGLVISWSKYPQGFIAHTIAAMLCIIAVMSLSNLASQASNRMDVLASIGSHSKVIMSYHLLVFTFVDIIFSQLGMFELSESSYLHHYSNPKLWYVYILAGVVMPMIGSKIVSMTKSKIMPLKTVSA